MNDYKLIDTNGKTVAMGTFEQMTAYLKHHAADGDYAIEGHDTDATFYRIGGIVYPSGGVLRGARMPPRSREECSAYFTQTVACETKDKPKKMKRKKRDR